MRPTVENRASDFSLFTFDRMRFPDHLHAQIEIALPTQGDLLASVDGVQHVVHTGEALLVFPNHLHGYSDKSEGAGLMLIFSPALLPDLGVDWESTHPHTPVIAPLSEDVRYATRRLTQLSGNVQLSRETLALSHLLLCGLLSGQTLERAENPVVDDILYHALRYLSRHYASPELSLKRAAHAIGVNEYHLSHLLNARLHTDFRRYDNLLRVDKARRLLTQKSLSVEEIAFRCGFSNLRSLDRVFGQICGCTPREYRKRLLCAPGETES